MNLLDDGVGQYLGVVPSGDAGQPGKQDSAESLSHYINEPCKWRDVRNESSIHPETPRSSFPFERETVSELGTGGFAKNKRIAVETENAARAMKAGV